MKDIITLLQHKKQEVITELKQGNTSQQGLISQLDKAISWLNTVEEHQLDTAKHYDIHQLPDTSNGMSFFHLMIDCESSDPNDWVEYTPNNKAIEMCMGDLVIVKK
ncbi:hypothetical protein AV926_11625 [Myroides marinus]|uniref:Uncharacterized protein n=1 Tax=Myroides marinus TaxID=703342 RepID=A0A161S518_9FLAO|nr:hypothetical protein [Myroides marinus]KZE79814.1 hypothetical protein AV926_11625 [Myroides marinus]